MIMPTCKHLVSEGFIFRFLMVFVAEVQIHSGQVYDEEEHLFPSLLMLCRLVNSMLGLKLVITICTTHVLTEINNSRCWQNVFFTLDIILVALE